ncbi:MAG: hypothetical protein J6M60_03330 [Clostridia bacterium]|nr:hypothetical protein [Clostridia bacterium]
MKKFGIILATIMCLFSTTVVYASNPNVGNTIKSMDTTANTANTIGGIVEKQTQTDQLVKMKDNEKNTLEDYQEAYGSQSYGLTAYILHLVQIYSIPFCFIGIAVSGIYQYVLGIRKLDTRDKGFAIMISIVTIFIIAQILPLIFAIVVKGWRS